MVGKPYWISRREEDLQEENARRISRSLVGRHKPDMKWIIEVMKRRYSRYGRNEKGL